MYAYIFHPIVSPKPLPCLALSWASDCCYDSAVNYWGSLALALEKAFVINKYIQYISVYRYDVIMETPLKNMKVNRDEDIPNIWKNKKSSKPPARQE